MKKTILPVLLATVSMSSAAIRPLTPEDVSVADTRKRNFYIHDGVITGGDQAITDALLLDVRHSKNKKFERLVLDIEGNRNGLPAAIERPPYFHIEVSPEQKRAVFTLFGNPRVAVDAKKVLKRMKKSKMLREFVMLPLVEKDRWTFALQFKKDVSVEAFELPDPVRVILDLKHRKVKAK